MMYSDISDAVIAERAAGVVGDQILQIRRPVHRRGPHPTHPVRRLGGTL